MHRFLIYSIFFTALIPLAYRTGFATIQIVDIPILATIAYRFLFYSNAKFSYIKNQRNTIKSIGNINIIDLLLTCALIFAIFSSIYTYKITHTFDMTLNIIRAAIVFFIIKDSPVHNDILHYRNNIAGFIFFLWSICVAIALIQYITNTHFGIVSQYLGDKSNVEGIYEDHFITSLRVSGPSTSANVFGLWIVLFCTFINVKILTGKNLKFFGFMFLVIINAMTFLMIILAVSRGSLVFYIASLMLVYFAYIVRHADAIGGKLLVHFGLFMSAALCALVYIQGLDVQGASRGIPILAKFFASGEDERSVYIFFAIELLRRPDILIAGTGFDAFYPALLAKNIDIGSHGLYGRVDFNEFRSGPHNFWVEALVEGGIFFFFSVTMLAIITPLTTFALMVKKRRTELQPVLAFGFVGCTCIIIPITLEDFALQTPVIFYLIFPLVAASIGVSAVNRRPRRKIWQTSREPKRAELVG